MNLKRIDAAISAYASHLDDGDNARLAFFRRLWGVMDEAAKESAIEQDGTYAPPEPACLKEALRAGKTAFFVAPAPVGGPLLGKTVEKIAFCMAEHGGYSQELAEALRTCDWERSVKASDVSLAGENPSTWVSAIEGILEDDGLDERATRLGTLAASLALRTLIDASAASAADVCARVLENEVRPLSCPVCGGAPGAARVGVTKSSDGRGKELWCPQCGAAWEFERVRCARCGTQNQSHLHYFNIEGDDAHRIATCDECGGYLRTIYQDDALAPFAFEVEDVVMAKLDLIALEHANLHCDSERRRRSVKGL